MIGHSAGNTSGRHVHELLLSPGSQCTQCFRGQRLAADAPFAATNILDRHPCDGPHVFTLDRDHRIRELDDHLLLLDEGVKRIV